MYRRILLLVSLMTLCLSASAQIVIKEDTVQCSIYFHQAKWHFDPKLRDNGERLSRFVKDVYFREGDPTMSIKRVQVNSGASPEGPQAFNDFLSEERAKAIIGFLLKDTGLDESQILIHSPGVDWETLADLVERTEGVPDKEEVLKIIRMKGYENDDIAHRKLLEDLNGGVPYMWLYKNLFPLVRHSNARIVYVSRLKTYIPKCKEIIYKPRFVAPENFSLEPPRVTPMQRDTLTFAVKTNLLYDAVSALNVEVEFPIKNHWSVAVEYVFPWWETGNKYCLEMLELGVEGRYWFRNNVYHAHKLEGHFVGAYCMSSMFDFQWDYRPAYQGEYWSAGLTYGYSLPIYKRINMEFSMSVGYLSSAYRHYYPADDYSLLWRDRFKVGRIGYFGPTKLKVSLMVPLHFSYNKKGGRK